MHSLVVGGSLRALDAAHLLCFLARHHALKRSAQTLAPTHPTHSSTLTLCSISTNVHTATPADAAHMHCFVSCHGSRPCYEGCRAVAQQGAMLPRPGDTVGVQALAPGVVNPPGANPYPTIAAPAAPPPQQPVWAPSIPGSVQGSMHGAMPPTGHGASPAPPQGFLQLWQRRLRGAVAQHHAARGHAHARHVHANTNTRSAVTAATTTTTPPPPLPLHPGAFMREPTHLLTQASLVHPNFVGMAAVHEGVVHFGSPPMGYGGMPETPHFGGHLPTTFVPGAPFPMPTPMYGDATPKRVGDGFKIAPHPSSLPPDLPLPGGAKPVPSGMVPMLPSWNSNVGDNEKRRRRRRR